MAQGKAVPLNVAEWIDTNGNSEPLRPRQRTAAYDKHYSAMVTAIIQSRYTTHKNTPGPVLAGSAQPGTWDWGVIDPFSTWYNVWLAFTVVAAVFTGWFEIYIMAFSDYPGLHPLDSSQSIIEYILLPIFALDMLLHFRVAIWRGTHLISQPREIAKVYGRGRFLVDLIGVVPFDYIVLAILGKQSAPQSEMGGISALKLLRVIRMYRLQYFFNFLAVHPAISYTFLVIVRNCTIVFYTVHFAGSMLYYISRLQSFSPTTTWVGVKADRFGGKSTVEKYILSMYWAMTTLTSIGYGDLHPYSVPEVVFVIAYQAFIIGLSAYLFGSITQLIIKFDSFTGRYHERLKNLLHFSRTHGLPQDMELCLADHLRLYLGSEAASDDQILSIYPSAVKKKALRLLYRRDFEACYLFSGCPEAFLDKLIIAARIEMYMPEVEIITRGEAVDHLFVLVSGTAQLTSGLPADPNPSPPPFNASRYSMDVEAHPSSYYDNKESTVSYESYLQLQAPTTAMLTDGSVFGELAFFLEDESLDTVMTTSMCRVLAISRKAYMAITAQSPVGARIILQNLLEAATEAVQKQEEIGLPLAARSTVWAAITPGGLQRHYSYPRTDTDGPSASPRDSIHTSVRGGTAMRNTSVHGGTAMQGGDVPCGDPVAARLSAQQGHLLNLQLNKLRKLLNDHDHPTPQPFGPTVSHRHTDNLPLPTSSVHPAPPNPRQRIPSYDSLVTHPSMVQPYPNPNPTPGPQGPSPAHPLPSTTTFPVPSAQSPFLARNDLQHDTSEEGRTGEGQAGDVSQPH